MNFASKIIAVLMMAATISQFAHAAQLGDIATADCTNPNGDYLHLNVSTQKFEFLWLNMLGTNSATSDHGVFMVGSTQLMGHFVVNSGEEFYAGLWNQSGDLVPSMKLKVYAHRNFGSEQGFEDMDCQLTFNN